MHQDLILRLGVTLGATSEAVQKWRERGFVPAAWHYRIAEAARRTGVTLSEDDFRRLEKVRPTPSRQSEPI